MKDVAEAILAVRNGAPPISVARQNTRTLTIEDAYAVQQSVVPAVGDVGGWKIGAPGPKAAPVWAPIFEKDILPNGTSLHRPPGTQVGVEVEIAFRLARDISPADLNGGEVLDAFGSALLIVEYVESRLENPAEAPDGWKLADNQVNGGLVIGKEILGWREANVETQHVALRIDRETTIDEERDNPGGHPFRLLRWAAEQGAGHCGGLKSGQIVTTGSLSGIQWYPAGTKVHATLPALEVEVSLTL